MQPDSLFDVLLLIVGFPAQLISYLVTSGLNIVFFDLLNLGPFLPIEL
jgi:hypothetical protein